MKDEASYFTLNRVKEYVRETGLRVAEYSYCQPRNKAVPVGDFAIFLELEPVIGLTSHHGVKLSNLDRSTFMNDDEDNDNDDGDDETGVKGSADYSLSSRLSAAAASAVESSSSSIASHNPFIEPNDEPEDYI